MIDPSPLLDHLENVLAHPDRGLVGLVDDLVAVSREHDIRLGWQAGSCSVILSGREPSDRIEVPMRKSVVRAILARVAVLCNERRPGSVSPYGGQGEIGDGPSGTIRAIFENTPETVSLELASILSPVGFSPAKSPQ